MSTHDENQGSFSNNSEDESPFFADMTLDLAEAHDIAETPEPNRKPLSQQTIENLPSMPAIPEPTPSAALSMPSTPDRSIGYSDNPSSVYSTDDDDSMGETNRVMASISNAPDQDPGGASTAHRGVNRMTPSAKRWPRDVQWAVGFCILVPLSLLLPMLFAKAPPPAADNPTENWLATAPAPRLATLHTLLWGWGATLVLSRLLYRTMGGGDGDDARHIASQLLLASAPISVSVYICLIVAMYVMLPNALIYIAIPLWYLARDIFLFRSWKMTASTPGGRQAFFQALTCMTLDILSRSLRRSSFYRMVSFLLVVQLVVIGWWRWALLAALRSHSLFWIIMAGIGGKWATGTIARLLTLIASGGISSWFAEQDSQVEGGEGMNDDEGEAMIEFTKINGPAPTADTAEEYGEIPEAYRTVDASIYKSSLDLDEGMDDDFEDEEEGDAALYSNVFSQPNGASPAINRSSVKQLFMSGVSISFGSVAKCGLLGGLAQFFWSQLRKVDTARATLQDFQSMPVGGNTDEERAVNRFLLKSNRLARDFVRNNSDMAMSHVAAYKKSYQRAALDVAILIDEKGKLLLPAVNSRRLA